MKRTLHLTRETLSELASTDLQSVHGASGQLCPTGVTWCVAVCDFVGRYVDRVTAAVNVTPECPA